MPDKMTKVKSRYRPEIDGLRAFAVIAVIINHFNKDLLPSGYLGVDIFFVISGYVITSSLADRKSKNFWDFLSGFYERRIKRLVPALVIFVLITSVLICLFNPVPGVTLGLGWRALFGISNINLYQSSTDYFAESTELNPFTHTWSLGVEEQFYLLFPFLIWFSGFGQQAAKGARNLFLWVGAMTIASLIGFIFFYQVNQPAAYFLMPSRFWEMAAGCLLFIGFQRRAKIEQALERVPPLLVVAAMVGVMFLPVTAAVPGTIGIVVLSAILIACLKQGTAAYALFTLEKMVYIGLISYSLYLWHWSVLSISRWTIGIHWWSAPIQCGLMLLLAICSYKWIETPMRKLNFTPKRWKVISAGAIFSLLAFGAVRGVAMPFSSLLFVGGKYFSEERFTSNKGSTKYGLTKEKCFGVPVADIDFWKCKHSSSERGETLYFIGDSHSLSLWKAAEAVASFSDSSLFLYGYSSTAFPVLEQHFSKKFDGRQYFAALESQIYSESVISSGDIVFLSLYLTSNFPETTKYLLHDWTSKVSALANFLDSKGANLVVFTPTPTFDDVHYSQCLNQWFNQLLDKSMCLIDKNSFTVKNAHILKSLRGLSLENRNVYVFDLLTAVCPGRNCSYSDDFYPLYRDTHHLNDYASEVHVAPKLIDFLEENQLLQIKENQLLQSTVKVDFLASLLKEAKFSNS